MSDIHEILSLYRERGHSEYGGERVTQVEHALQTAMLAEQANASPALIAAALLHDIGHLVHSLPDDAPDQGVDDVHEDLGFRYLENTFGPDVTEPVRLHVSAKRFLCATDPEYAKQLSEPSIVSLSLQGGPMTREEVAEFEASPFAADAVRLRMWDDLAKTENLETPTLDYFKRFLSAAAINGRHQQGPCS